jgi:hypothetical protein
MLLEQTNNLQEMLGTAHNRIGQNKIAMVIQTTQVEFTGNVQF